MLKFDVTKLNVAIDQQLKTTTSPLSTPTSQPSSAEKTIAWVKPSLLRPSCHQCTESPCRPFPNRRLHTQTPSLLGAARFACFARLRSKGQRVQWRSQRRRTGHRRRRRGNRPSCKGKGRDTHCDGAPVVRPLGPCGTERMSVRIIANQFPLTVE